MFYALTQRPVRALAVMVLALGLAGTVSADTTRRIQFAGGSDHAEVSDKIKGYDGASFLVGASAGQTLKVEMSSPNGAAYFNVTAPGANEAMFIGSISGERFEGTLPVSGDYRIDVYMMRSAARRDEVAKFKLKISVPADHAVTPVPKAVNDFADGLAGGPDFWEVTNLTPGDTLNVRNGPGTGEQIRGHLAMGEVVRNQGCARVDEQRWCKVASDARGLVGWVRGNYLREAAPPSDIAQPFPGVATPVAPNGKPFDATGLVPCAHHQGQPAMPCAFGVQRRGLGSADVFVAFPDGGQRLISFADGKPSAADSNKELKVRREADLWFLRIGAERFEIPDAVVTGG